MFESLPEPLSLQSGLAALELEDLAAIAGRVGLQEELTSKARLLANIPEHLTDRNTVRRFLRELEAEVAEVVFVAAACEKLLSVLGPSVLARFGATAAPLDALTRGLLLPDAATGLYRPPAEILPYVHDEAGKRLGAAAAEPPAHAVTLEPLSAFRDAVTTWCYVIKNRITLTQSGATPKRALAKVAPSLEVTEEEAPLANAAKGFGYSRLELLAEDLERRGALTRDNGDLRAGPWLTGDLVREATVFCAALVRAVAEEDESAGALLAAYACALSPVGQWRPVASLARSVRAVAPEADEASVRKALFALFVCGVAAAGEGADGLLVFARTEELDVLNRPPAQAAEPRFLLGGNFELKVPYDVPTEIRLKLDAFAEQTSGGRLPSYRVSKATFYRALDAGISVDEVLSFLEKHVSKPVPQNVAFSLRGWAERYGKISFFDHLVVAAETPETADEIAKLPSVAPYVKGRRELHAIEISREDYAAVRDALTADGYLPRSLGGEAEADVSARALFEAGPHPTPDVRPAEAEVESAAAVVEFAVAQGKGLRLWLKGEEEPVEVEPCKITVQRGRAYLHVTGDGDRTRIPVTAIARATVK
jgi:hypothetical protein